MPLEASIDPADKIIKLDLIGKFTFENFRETYETILSHADFQTSMPSIFDLRKGNAASLFTEDLVHTVNLIKKQMPKRGVHYKVAFVAHQELNEEIKRMYEVYGAGVPFLIEVFNRYEDAHRWVSTELTSKRDMP